MADKIEIKGEGYVVTVYPNCTIQTTGNVPSNIERAIDGLCGVALSQEAIRRAIEFEIKNNLQKGHLK